MKQKNTKSRGKTRSTPSLTDLDWTVRLDWSLTKEEKTDDYSGHYGITSSRPAERRPLERRTLMPKWNPWNAPLDNNNIYSIFIYGSLYKTQENVTKICLFASCYMMINNCTVTVRGNEHTNQIKKEMDKK